MISKSWAKTANYLTAFGVIILLFSFIAHASNGGDYVFKDAEGNNIILPVNRPITVLASPGILSKAAPFHTPIIKSKVRKEGLESVRELTLRLSEPVQEEQEDKITKAYLLDKDYYVIGFAKFRPGKQEVSFRLNGVVNYIQIYLECDEHGLWRTDLRFEKAKPGQ